jgi:hypothetical protein
VAKNELTPISRFPSIGPGHALALNRPCPPLAALPFFLGFLCHNPASFTFKEGQ